MSIMKKLFQKAIYVATAALFVAPISYAGEY